MFFEYSVLIANQPEYLESLTQNVKIAAELQYIQERALKKHN